MVPQEQEDGQARRKQRKSDSRFVVGARHDRLTLETQHTQAYERYQDDVRISFVRERKVDHHAQRLPERNEQNNY
jgi:hypothetical protein